MLSARQKSIDSLEELCGALHLHTKYSDGGVDFAELIDAAQYTGLDFVAVTDHMTLQGKYDWREKWHGPVFVLVGYEHNDANNLNHYLIFGIDTVLGRGLQPQEYISEARERGGLGFLAHPVERRHYFKKYPPFPWTEWSVSGFDGIELWNQMSEWVENLKSWRSYVRIFFPRRLLQGAPKRLLQKWDRLNAEQFVSAIGGVDAHTIRVGVGPVSIRIFPIRVELKGIRTHLFFERPVSRNDSKSARLELLDALRKGRGFISNYRRGNARGTRMYYKEANGRYVLPGKTAKTVAFPGRLVADFPGPADIRFIRNGVVLRTAANQHYAEFAVSEKGVYRIEAFRGGRGWVYSNPFPIGAYPFR